MQKQDVVVVGGGVIGCSIAFSLARAGASVRVVERDEIGVHASSAAAGMLAPIAESLGEGPIFGPGLRSLASFPAWVDELRELSGIDPELHLSGILRVVRGSVEHERYATAAPRLAEQGCTWLDPDELHKREPGLSAEATGALWSPREAHVNSLLLTRACAAAARRRGAEISTGTPVLEILRDGDRVTGVRTPGESIAAPEVVLASGAWAGFAEDLCGIALAVEPIRGQMLALEPATPLPRSILWDDRVYLVPRRDGTLGVGATIERAGFDARPTAAGVAWLLEGARRLVPGLDEARFLSTWSGLRPATADELPLIGPLPGVRGLSVATAHYRNGVLLSQITGEAVAARILRGETTPGFEAFDPARGAC